MKHKVITIHAGKKTQGPTPGDVAAILAVIEERFTRPELRHNADGIAVLVDDWNNLR